MFSVFLVFVTFVLIVCFGFCIFKICLVVLLRFFVGIGFCLSVCLFACLFPMP